METPFGTSVQCPVLIGRAPHLEALRGLLKMAMSGRGRMALISGEAGVGKSRLADEIAAHATAGGFLVGLARELGDPDLIARSLNRVGNWRLNAAGPEEALGFHREALALFEASRDRRGLAQTLDLLGMTYNLRGDPWQSAGYYSRAIAAFRELDDRQGLVNSLVIWLLQGGSYWHDTLVPADLDDDEVRPAGDEALRLAREIAWPAGESYVLYELALRLGPRSEYARALGYARSGLAIAEAMRRVHVALATLYRAARRHPEAAREFAAARALIEELADGLADEVIREAFVRAAARTLPRARTPSPLQAAKQAFVGLTRRERGVAHLIAEGRSNAEIAATLVVGKRTVETHVGNILAKLGLTSRAQVAAWAIAHGLHRDAE